MKQKVSQISPDKLYASLLKRKNEQEQQARLKSPIVTANKYLVSSNRNSGGSQKIEAKKSRPASGKDLKDVSKVLLKKTNARQNSKLVETKENSQNLSTSALSLLLKIKQDKYENKQSQIQQAKDPYNQETIQKKYQKLMEMTKQQQQLILKPKLFKGPRSISNPDISTMQLQIVKANGQSAAGMLYNGQTKTNQDIFKLIPKFCHRENDWYIQVSDGHGTNGHQVAQFLQEVLPQFVQQGVVHMTSCYERDKQINQVLKNCFLQTSDELMDSGIDITYSGATTVIVLSFDNVLYCANIGDSRAIIGRYDNKLSVIELSKDHKPDCFLEQARILQRGGRVQAYSDEDGNPIGPARVWKLDEDVPGLAMSRSFGDYVASQVGVICEPEIIKHSLLPCDKFIVVASDGIWEFLSNEQVVEIIYEYYKKDDSQGACQKLIQLAREAWQREDEVIDDITIVVAFIK
ncbi:unnamed protein product [Paramecium pentaurelia]|uniref:PPM-type phosphatase domain-containing protein n=1 Tax=Paramecium pentaurelia TaxID=43138 RepID=A0A8S1YES1_9CILI|nr:unnamed protein product [Paramecium pentaurelia]